MDRKTRAGQHVAVIDRYAIANFCTSLGSGESGLQRFIAQLARDALGPKYVKIFSAWDSETLRGENIRTLRDKLSELARNVTVGTIREMELVMVPSNAFGNASHDRYIRFSDHAWELGVGLQIFEGVVTPRASTATLKCCLEYPEFGKKELALRQARGAKTIQIRV